MMTMCAMHALDLKPELHFEYKITIHSVQGGF